MAIHCSRCGSQPHWLVTAGYQSPTERTGRLLVYCDTCRRDMNPVLGAVVPLELATSQPELILGFLYENAYTTSHPGTVAEILQLPAVTWNTKVNPTPLERPVGDEDTPQQP